jgi:tetratricopeptide (TPR) repeat protein
MQRLQFFSDKHTTGVFIRAISGALVVAALTYAGFFLYTGNTWGLIKEGRLSISTLLFERGNYYFGGKAYDLDAALWSFEKALVFENSDKNPIYYQVGRIAFIKGDLDKAILYFNTQLEEDPTFMQAYYMRGLTYGYLGQFSAAVRDFERFLEERPTSWAGHNDIAWVFFRQADFINAEKYARQGLGYSPDNPWLANALGVALLNRGEYEEAEKFLQKSQDGFLSMNPERWGGAYPGNDPRVYEEGYRATLASVEANLLLVRTKRSE